jgi:microfibrillar-associated protein 1
VHAADARSECAAAAAVRRSSSAQPCVHVPPAAATVTTDSAASVSAPFLFGQDDDSVKTDDPAKEDARKKTYDGATLEDKFDKSALPKVMQVKKFGFSGRTKYTHLVDQDTTNFESAWAGADDLRDKYFSKSAGMKMNGDLNNAGKKRRRD